MTLNFTETSPGVWEAERDGFDYRITSGQERVPWCSLEIRFGNRRSVLDPTFIHVEKAKNYANAHASAVATAIENAKPKWIPVGESWPEKDGHYLTLSKEGSVVVLFFYGLGGPSPSFTFSRSKTVHGFVTHWQPLPTPPDGGKV